MNSSISAAVTGPTPYFETGPTSSYLWFGGPISFPASNTKSKVELASFSKVTLFFAQNSYTFKKKLISYKLLYF